jgi:hypothetical protein
LHQLPAGHATYLTGRAFFPQLISGPFSNGLTIAFGFAIAACLVAALASVLVGGKYLHVDHQPQPSATDQDGNSHVIASARHRHT